MLYESFYTEAVLMCRSRGSDGVGGFRNTWEEGDILSVAFSSLTPTERIAAGQASVGYTDTILVPAETELKAQDIFLADGAYYLVVSHLPRTPRCASFGFDRYNVRRLEALP